MAEGSSSEPIRFAPQPGPQTDFLSTHADIAIYGGSAGSGKSFALLIEPVRHYENGKFNAVIFRRTTTQVRNPGGMWDESQQIYRPLKGHSREPTLEWIFPSNMAVKFAHLQHEHTIYDWQGSQIPLIGFDELTHFTETQFWYMLSRNRSTSGVPGYVRATCNPDSDSWVRKLVDWYIGPDGYPIKERSGIIRWFVRREDALIWGNTRDELVAQYGEEAQPKSFTFVAASIYDNRILMEKDPSYLANLMALARVDRLRLLGGNWNVRPTAGLYFQREWFEIIDALPANCIRVVRGWDRAATKPSETNKDPDWTAGVKMYRHVTGLFIIAEVRRTRDTPLKVENFIKNTATQDGYEVPVAIDQDPGSSGVADAENYVRLLAGWDVRVTKPTGDKANRAKPLSAQCEAGNVKLLRGDWNEAFLSELENFTGEDGEGHDDQVDAAASAFNFLAQDLGILDFFK